MEELGKIQALTLNPNLKSRPEIEWSVCLNGRLEWNWAVPWSMSEILTQNVKPQSIIDTASIIQW